MATEKLRLEEESRATKQYSPTLRKLIILIGLFELIILVGCIVSLFVLFELAISDLQANCTSTTSTNPNPFHTTTLRSPANDDDLGELFENDQDAEDAEETELDIGRNLNFLEPKLFAQIGAKKKFYMRSLANAGSALALAAVILVLTVQGASKKAGNANGLVPRLVVQIVGILALVGIIALYAVTCAWNGNGRPRFQVPNYYRLGTTITCWTVMGVAVNALFFELCMFAVVLRMYLAARGD